MDESVKNPKRLHQDKVPQPAANLMKLLLELPAVPQAAISAEETAQARSQRDRRQKERDAS